MVLGIVRVTEDAENIISCHAVYELDYTTSTMLNTFVFYVYNGYKIFFYRLFEPFECMQNHYSCMMILIIICTNQSMNTIASLSGHDKFYHNYACITRWLYNNIMYIHYSYVTVFQQLLTSDCTPQSVRCSVAFALPPSSHCPAFI